MNPKPKLVRLSDAAVELGVSVKTIKKYCLCGILECRRLPSGHWRVSRAALNALLRDESYRPESP